VPFSIDSGDGIRMLVSYHDANSKYTDSHTVSIFDIFGVNGEKYNVVDYDIIELKKALQRLGKQLIIPEGVLFNYAKDRYWNIPCIFHGAPNPQDDILNTILALNQLTQALIGKKREAVISFTLAWNIEDKEVRVSIMGHVDDLLAWFSQNKTIPTSRNEFIKWLEKQRKYLNQKIGKNSNAPDVEDICQLDGVLYMKRHTVGDEFNPEFQEVENGFGIKYQIPNNDNALFDEMNSHNIRPVLACIVKRKTCLKTKLNYIDSPLSKILDDDVHTSIDEIEFLHAQWSDKAFD
jgi:hypothetical protein